MTAIGKVYLVGAGPGDPGLVTLRAAQLLRDADLILHDALVDERILALANPAAELISVGKRAGGSRTEQSEINRLLVDYARAGRTVLRLKGGDPFLFGRGGEEALALAEAGIAFEVVPGVTSAVAAGAYAGIPLTHRGLASACIFVTGHEDPTKAESDVNWQELAGSGATICIYMGLAQLGPLTQKLIDAGRSADEPAALVSCATLPEQKTLTSTLAEIAEAATETGITPPAILIVGQVASLREKLSWFEARPLIGRRVLITRPADQSASLIDRLTLLGARPILWPTIAIEPVEDMTELDQALKNLSSFDWLAFSSANAVKIFFKRLDALGLDARAFGSARVAAMGPATAQVLREHALRADAVPDEYVAESLLKAIQSSGDLRGKRILLPRSDIGREVVAKGLREAGAEVTELVIYHTACATQTKASIKNMVEAKPDVLTFTSSSTVTNFVKIVGKDIARRLAEKAIIVSIGPITSETLRRHGLPVTVEADEHTTEGMIEALVAYCTTHTAHRASR